MTVGSVGEREPGPPHDDLEATCCAVAYGDPLVELLVGESIHPGGLSTTRTLLTAAGLVPGRRLLDAGCGLGASARLAAAAFGLHVDACDVSETAIERARRLSADHGDRVRFVVGSVLALPYRESAFDAVLVECVLSATDRARALREIRRVLKPDGRLLGSDMTIARPVDWPEPLATVLCLWGAWRPGELGAALGRAGFAIERQWDETPALSTFLDRIESRWALLRSLTGDATVGAEVRRYTARLGLELPGPLVPETVFAAARAAVAAGGVGYRAWIARPLAQR